MTPPRVHRRRHDRGDQAAFTLLEVMLAITIFGIVATTIYGTFSRTLASKAVGEQRIDVVRTGRTAVARIADEITAATAPIQMRTDKKFQSVAGGTADAPLDSIAFSTLTSARGPEALGTDQRVVEYFFALDGRGSQRARGDEQLTGGRRFDGANRPSTLTGGGGPQNADTRAWTDDDAYDFFAPFGADALRQHGVPVERLLRREALVVQPNALDDAFTTVFLDDVASLRFRFCDGTEWHDDWDSDDPSIYRNGMPLAVAVDLALYDEVGAVHHFATIADVAVAKRTDTEHPCPPWSDTVGGMQRTRTSGGKTSP